MAGMMAKIHRMVSDMAPHQVGDMVKPQDHAERMLTSATRERKAQQTVLFGYRNLDQWTGGMHAGNLIILGARPGMGKSQIMQEVMTFNADRDKTVLVASAEMSLVEWDERQIAMEAGYGLADQRVRDPNDREMEKIQALVSRTSERPLYFLEGRLALANIERQAHYLRDTIGLHLIAVDYVQLLADTVEGDTIRERVGFISRTLKRLARDCQCPVLMASQLSRNVETRQDKTPILADLKETSDLEQDSDLVLLLHRPELYDAAKEPGMAYVYIAKQRQGGRHGRVALKWQDYRYHDPSEIREEDTCQRLPARMFATA
jgi:replicative DNA helicase